MEHDIDIHLSRLATWIIQTLGSALIWATLVAFAVLLLAAATREYELAWWAAVLGPLVFALRLTTATAPLPLDVEDP